MVTFEYSFNRAPTVFKVRALSNEQEWIDWKSYGVSHILLPFRHCFPMEPFSLCCLYCPPAFSVI